MTDSGLLKLHRALVSTPSISHNETRIADLVEERVRGFGAEIWRIGNNVIARAGQGPRLLMNSHLDTVPANSGWSRDPWSPDIVDGRIYGLGSNDAKGCVAAMLAAFSRVAARGGPCEVVLMLVPEEETGGKGTEAALPWLIDELSWTPEGAIVGEPTDLQIGTEQKGLMVLELAAKGEACHAANAEAMGAKNPIWELAEDLCRLRSVDLGPKHPSLGGATLQPTVLKAAEAHNQVPPQALAVLDMRTVPGITHAELADRIRREVTGEVRERSLRLEPYSCPADAKIVRSALAAGGKGLFASPTMSDQTFFRGIPCIKCGPGVSARSHSADEFLPVEELLAGADFYRRAIDAFSTLDQEVSA